MTSIQPELWVENAREALAFYGAAFSATVLHLVGEADDIVVQLGVGDAAFWIAPPSSTMKRLDPRAIGGATSRTLLVVDDPTGSQRRPFAPVRRKRHPSPTSTAGGSAGSSTRSATSGRSASHSAPGRRYQPAKDERER